MELVICVSTTQSVTAILHLLTDLLQLPVTQTTPLLTSPWAVTGKLILFIHALILFIFSNDLKSRCSKFFFVRPRFVILSWNNFCNVLPMTLRDEVEVHLDELTLGRYILIKFLRPRDVVNAERIGILGVRFHGHVTSSSAVDNTIKVIRNIQQSDNVSTVSLIQYPCSTMTSHVQVKHVSNEQW